MRIVITLLSVTSFLTGLIAAWNWYRSSLIEPEPEWRFEPVDEKLKRMGWEAATLRAFGEVGQMQAAAALWTATSVVFSSLSSLLGAVV